MTGREPGHVLFTTDAFPPEIGGVERVTYELARALVARDVRVTVLTRRPPDTAPEETVEGIRVIRYDVARRFAPRVYWSYVREVERRTRRLLAEDPPDILHTHLTLASYGALKAFAQAGRPIVASFYGPWDKEFAVEADALRRHASPFYRLYLDGQMALQRHMQRRNLRMAHGIVPLSDYSRVMIDELAPGVADKVTKIPGGIDPTRFTATPNEFDAQVPWLGGNADAGDNRPVILTVRRLVHRMGVDLLIDALALLRERGVEARLYIGGRGPRREDLEAQVTKLGLAEQVHFLGYVADELLPALYRHADVFVLPTRAQENFGLPVFEAAACGCPVVATAVGSLPEMIRAVDSPYEAQVATAESLADAMHRALADRGPTIDAWRERVVRSVPRDYAWSAIAERHIDHYRKVLACAS
ncbi:glycosyltransferase family 4 protein [bacterium]|nr:glycosyltransferase family 4 protein [bacterium]